MGVYMVTFEDQVSSSFSSATANLQNIIQLEATRAISDKTSSLLFSVTHIYIYAYFLDSSIDVMIQLVNQI